MESWVKTQKLKKYICKSSHEEEDYMFVLKRWRRKPSSLGMKTHWRVMCLEERSLRKTRRIKVQGAEAKGNTLAKWGEMPSFSFLKQKRGRTSQAHDCEVLHRRCWELRFDLLALAASMPGTESELPASFCQPWYTHRQKCGQPTRTLESCKHDHRTGRLSLSTPGSKLSYFLISNQPSSPVLQMPSLIKVKQDWRQKPRGSPNTFLHEVMISYAVLDRKGSESSSNKYR